MNSYTRILTFSGEARSGKGTTVSALSERLGELEVSHTVIDQGQKFRAMANVALRQGVNVEAQEEVFNFISDEATQPLLIEELDDIQNLSAPEMKDRLYKPAMSHASAKIASEPLAHVFATDLLREQVFAAASENVSAVIIDGRSVEKYARKYDEENPKVLYLGGFFFRCDSAIAARRSLGQFKSFEHMDHEEKEALLQEALRISDRNKADSLRSADPMQIPRNAYEIALADFYDPCKGMVTHRGKQTNTTYGKAYKLLDHKIGVVDTSYAPSISAMTIPIVDLAVHALYHRGNTSAPGHQLDISQVFSWGKKTHEAMQDLSA